MIKRSRLFMALVGFSFVAVMMMATLISAEDAKQAPAKTTEKASAPAKEDTKAKQDDATIIAQQKASYPLDTCVVRDSKLGEMGEPVDYVYKGRLVRFCCKGCIKAFEKDPEKYLAKIDAAAKAKQNAKPEAKPDAEKSKADPHAGHGDHQK